MARNTTTAQYLSGSITLPSAFTLFMRLSAPQTGSTAIAFETHSGSTSIFSLTSGELRFYRSFSTTQGKWSAGTPSWSSQNTLAIRHDGTSTAPSVRLNGSNRTITQTQAPSGTVTGTAATAYVLNGNAGTSPWGGTSKYGCDYAIYNRVLSDSEVDSLAAGHLIQSGLVYAWRMAGSASPEPNLIGGVDLAVTGATSATDPSTVFAAPSQVTGLTATPSGSAMSLAWTSQSDAVTYTVQRSPSGAGTWATIATPGTNSYSDSGLANGTYDYRVAATNQLGTGTYSSTASGTISSGGGGGSWHTTTATRPLIDRIKRATVAATSGEGFLSLSTDNSAWSYFAGPLTGNVLTAVASLAAAQAAPVALPTDGYWDLPSITEARVIRLHHRSNGTSPYTIYEYYPRRIIQSDDIEAEAIKAIHIAAGAITADKISAITLSAITTNTGDLSVSGALTLGIAGKLRTAADETVIDSSGMSLAMPAAYNDPAAIKFKDGATLHGFLAGNKTDASTVNVGLASQSTIANQSVTLRALNPGVATATVFTQVNGGVAKVNLQAVDSAVAALTLTTSGVTIDKGLNIGSATGAATGQIKTSGDVNAGGLLNVTGVSAFHGAGPDANIAMLIKGIGTTSGTRGLRVTDSSGNINLDIYDNGTGVLRAASWTYTSDASKKRNIRAYDTSKATANALKSIKVQQFDYIDGLANQVGYTAQELQAVLPEAVTEDAGGTLGVRSLEPWIILWLQQQQETIEAQQRQIDTLTQQVQALLAGGKKP